MGCNSTTPDTDELVFNSLSNKQRVGLVERAREQFENSQEQRNLQDADVRNNLRTRKRMRWNQHMHQTFGGKHIWQTLAFTGRWEGAEGDTN